MDPKFPLLSQYSANLQLDKVAVNRPLTTEIQILLKEGGFYKGALDGTFGMQTATAFKLFKEAAYLEHPAVLGPATAEALLEIAGDAVHPNPKEAMAPPVPLPTGRGMRLPDGSTVYTGALITGSRNFTWGEATKGGGRIPRDGTITAKIIKAAVYLDQIRSFLDGRPITITSWYRPPDVNRQQGGVSNSTHILGHGVDFLVGGIPPLEVYRRLNNWHGGQGGLGRSSHFTHLDLRGYYSRWEYGS